MELTNAYGTEEDTHNTKRRREHKKTCVTQENVWNTQKISTILKDDENI